MNMLLPSASLARLWLKTIAALGILALLSLPAGAQIVTNASDNAGNYSSGWTNGANGGTGFGAWSISSSGGTGGFGGNFIGNPANAGITGMATNSFALYANPTGTGAYANAERNINVPLAIGQTLSFQWGINYDSRGGGNKGFNLIANGGEIVNVNNAGTSLITLNGTSIGSGYGTEAMNWNFTRTTANTITVVANKRDGGTYSNNITVASGAVSAIKFYAYSMQAGNEAQPYFNNLQIAGIPPNTITNRVTFSVNMSYQASQGLFSSNSNTVEVRGDFNGWNGNQLTNQGDNIYLGTFDVTGTEGSAANYKFWNSFLTNTPSQGYEDGSNRTLTLGAAGASTNLPTVYFSNLAGRRFVTFSVNMAIQQGKGAFNPAVNTNVQVRGDFNGWSGNQLTNQGGSVYSGTFLLSSSATNSNVDYKFYYASGTNDVWENLANTNNRSLSLVFNSDGSNAPALVLATNFFSNELFYSTPTSLSGFATTQGVASTNQTLTVNGEGLTGNIVATAPTGYEVSAGGTTYGPTANIVPASGSVSAASLSVRIAASAAAGTPSGNVQLASTGSQQVNIAVSGSVTNPYNAWAGGYSLDPAVTSGPTAGAPTADPDNDGFNNQSEYAFGTDPTQGNAALLSTSVSGGNMIVTWLQRTDAAPGAYKVKTTPSLDTPFTVDATLTAAITDGAATPTPPAGYVRKQVSVATSSGRNFLALAFD